VFYLTKCFTFNVQAWELSTQMQIFVANFCGCETDFPWRKTIVRREKQLVVQKKKKEKKGSTGFSSAPNTRKIWSAFTCGYCHSWSHNCELSHLLLLSQAGNRLELSHSYTLLCYVSAKKKRMLQKF